MHINDLKNKRVTVMGLGLHGGGAATARFLSEAGARVIVTDIKSKEELLPSVEKLKKYKNIEFVFNAHRTEDFTKVDMVIKSPAAPWSNKYVKMALEHKVPVEMDSSLFFKLCKNEIIGITGTKGKTTTATLIYEILKTAGKEVVKAGVGQVSVLDKLAELKKDTIVVFELSSWRLSALGRGKVSPHVAVLTNIYPDHMNYYKTMAEYVKDKLFICESQKAGDFCVMNCDDEALSGCQIKTKSEIIKISEKKIETGRSVYLNEEAIYLSDGNNEKKIIALGDIKLSGRHNLHNIMLAVGASLPFGATPDEMRKTLREFSGVAHRLEFIREFDGVRYINDSAATMPEAAIAGLNSFSENVILICGGSDKNLDMGKFAKEISEKAKGVIFLKGAATEKILSDMKKLRSDHDREYKVVESMEKAIELATKEAEKGDVILLSPGAASFGLFLNEFDRGDKFKEAVKKMK